MTEQERCETAFKALCVTCPWASWPEFEAGWNAALSSDADGEPVAWITRDAEGAEADWEIAWCWKKKPTMVKGCWLPLSIEKGTAGHDMLLEPASWLIGRDLQPGGIFEVLRIVVREVKP